MIPIIVGAVAALFLLICGLIRWRRRAGGGMMRSSQACGGTGGPSSNLPKPYDAPLYHGYNAGSYYQTAPPAPPLVQTQAPQYPPRGHNSCHGHSRSRRVSPPTTRYMPEPTTSAPPQLRHEPSTTISLPISSPDPSPLSVLSSTDRDEAVVTPPSVSSPPPPPISSPPPPSSSPVHPSYPPPPVSPPPSASPPPTQGNDAESRPSPLPSSRNPFVAPPPAPPSSRNPFLTISSPAHPLPHSFSTVPPTNALHSLALAPMNTGASSNIVDEPPPAYTPV